MTKKRNVIKIIISLILLIIIVLIVLKIKQTGEIELTQLSSRTQDGMMGYIIRTNNEKTIVIDGGRYEDSETLKQYIQKYGNKVDYWFITHLHKDHVGAFIEIVENTDIKIENIYYSVNSLDWYKQNEEKRADEAENFYRTLENEKIKSIKKKPNIGEQIIISDNIKIEILGLANSEITNNAINNSSMVFRMYVNDKKILFLGDTGIESSKKLIDKYGENLKSDIVQMAHHGQGGATEELYKLVKPEICLWPTAEWLWNNDFGNGYNTGNWTTIETREWMENIGVTKNYVAKDGDITIIVK